MNSPNTMLLFIFLPMATAALIPVFEKVWKELVDLLAIIAALALVVLALSFSTPLAIFGAQFTNLPEAFQVSQMLCLDRLSLLLVLVINGIGLCALIFSVEYMRHYGGKPKYYALFMLMLAGMNGVVLAHDLFTLYVFLEVAACSSYALVAFGLEHDELEAAFKYLVLAAAASALILLGIALIYFRTGGLDFGDVSRTISTQLLRGDVAVIFVILLFLVGFGLKMALVPFHAWLPDAHPSAPAPISAMLSGVLIKASGVYALIRIFYNVLGIQALPQVGQTMMALGVLTIVIASLLALVQTDFKRLLAYSSISQIGYIMLGFGRGTPLGFVGALYHLMNHATFKSLLFLVSGATQQATGTRDLTRMGGLAKRLPITATTSVFGSLAIAGVPPFNGFVSKTVIVVALVSAGLRNSRALYYWYAAVAVLFSLLTLAYFLKIQRKAFFGQLSAAFAEAQEVGVAMALPMVLLAVLCVALGVAYPWLYNVLLNPAANVLASLIVK
ncbi:MAG: complex I subunit 5 family protein [candidate division WOR-3 bacterium]